MTSPGGSSESVEMYLKSVAELGGDVSLVSIGSVAERLGVSPVSANEMMKRLADQGLINHQPYKGVTLTMAGRRQANSVIRRQRLWECFLIDHLNLDWAQAHDLACDLEHATAPQVETALSEYLGNPQRCPHGNPIPGQEGQLGQDEAMPLSQLPVGQFGLVSALSPENGELLAYLAERELKPGQQVTVLAAAPLDGPLTLKVGSREVVLGLKLASLVLVERATPNE